MPGPSTGWDRSLAVLAPPAYRVTPVCLVAMSTTDHWIGNWLVIQCAVSAYMDPGNHKPATPDRSLQRHVRTRVPSQDGRNRAGFAQIRSPRLRSRIEVDQPTLLNVTPSVKVLIVEFALHPSGSSHFSPQSTSISFKSNVSPAGCPSTAMGSRGTPLTSYIPTSSLYSPSGSVSGTGTP